MPKSAFGVRSPFRYFQISRSRSSGVLFFIDSEPFCGSICWRQPLIGTEPQMVRPQPGGGVAAAVGVVVAATVAVAVDVAVMVAPGPGVVVTVTVAVAVVVGVGVAVTVAVGVGDATLMSTVAVFESCVPSLTL